MAVFFIGTAIRHIYCTLATHLRNDISRAHTTGFLSVIPMSTRAGHKASIMLHQSGVRTETRTKMLGHSIETVSRYGAPGESEIEKAASLLDHAEAA